MIKTIRCSNCNGKSFFADRSLAGRLVCSSCGIALGSKSNYSFLKSSLSQRKLTKLHYLIIIGLIIAILIIFL